MTHNVPQPLLISVHYSNGDVRAFLRNNPGNILSIVTSLRSLSESRADYGMVSFIR